MLVLSRKVGEWIMIGGKIQVTIVGIDRRRVRVGIMAPNSVSVDREEVAKRKLVSPDPTGK